MHCCFRIRSRALFRIWCLLSASHAVGACQRFQLPLVLGMCLPSMSHRLLSSTPFSGTSCSLLTIAFLLSMASPSSPMLTFMLLQGASFARSFDIVFETPFSLVVRLCCCKLIVWYVHLLLASTCCFSVYSTFSNYSFSPRLVACQIKLTSSFWRPLLCVHGLSDRLLWVVPRHSLWCFMAPHLQFSAFARFMNRIYISLAAGRSGRSVRLLP